VEAAPKNRRKQFVIDDEAVVLGADGVSDFNALHHGSYNGEGVPRPSTLMNCACDRDETSAG